VAAGGDEVADFMKNGGNFEEEGVVLGKLVQILGLLKEAEGEEAGVGGVLGIGAVALREMFCRAKNFVSKLGGVLRVVGEVGEESELVVRAGDPDRGDSKYLSDGEVDGESGNDGAGGLVVELVAANAFVLGGIGYFVAQLLEGFEAGFGAVRFCEEGGEVLDLVADDDDVLDTISAEVVVDLGDDASDLVVDEVDGGCAKEVGLADGFPGSVGSHAVGIVTDDVAVFEKEDAGVTRSGVNDEGIALPHGRGVEQAAAGLKKDEPGHFSIIESFELDVTGDEEAIAKDVGVFGLGKGVGGDGAEREVGDAELGEHLSESFDNGDAALDGFATNAAVAENVVSQGKRFFEIVEGLAILIQHDHGDCGSSDVNGGEEVRRRHGDSSAVAGKAVR